MNTTLNKILRERAQAYQDIHDAVVKDNDRLYALNQDLVEALTLMLAIVDESAGVAGYHRNGDIAEWDGFEAIDIAEAALAKAQGETK